MVAGKVLHDADLVRRVDEAEARIAELSIQQNRGSQTTQTAQKLGSVGLFAISHNGCSQNGMLAYVLSQQSQDSAWYCLTVLCVQVWMKRAHKAMQLSCLLPMAEGASIVKTACAAVLSSFQTAPYTIPDLTGRVFASKLRS